MASAIHLVCMRRGLSFDGLKLIDPRSLLYRSDSWELLPSEAEQMLGGWVYLHAEKTGSSEFGGKIHRVDLLQNGISMRQPIFGIVFRVRREARHRTWRGHHNKPAWSGGLVPLALPHEIGRPKTMDSEDIRRRVPHTPKAAGACSDHLGT